MARRYNCALDNSLRGLFALLFFVGIATSAWAQFETRATHSLPGETSGVALGDFNGDGKLDVAATAGESLVILLGNGDGTFRAGATYPGVFYSIVAADFNNDGTLDLIVSPGSNNVEVFLGNGDGTFQPPKISATTDGPAFIAVGDFNGDHKLDVAIVDQPYVSILLGNGDGTFQPPTDNESFVGPQALAVGDFNNDHRLDVVVVGSFGGSANVGVLLGNGNGTLQDSLTYPLTYQPESVAAADFNGDGNLDVVVGDLYGSGAVTVFLGKGDGSFDSGQTYLGGGNLVIVGDFNGDGKLDLVAEPSVYGAAEFLGNGDGTFEPAQVYASNKGNPAAAGDLNGDHKLDLLLFEFLGSSVTSMLNTGSLKFAPSKPLEFPFQLVNTASKPETVTLTNTGANAISITSIKPSGEFKVADTCGGSLAPGAECAISVVFEPRSKGTIVGSVSIVDGATPEPQLIELKGSATVVKVDPTSLDFGGQKIGTKSAPQLVTAINKGNMAITYSSVGIGGANFGNFSETDNCAGFSIPPGGSCQVSVTFAPTKTGPRSAALFINPKGMIRPPTVALTGTGD